MNKKILTAVMATMMIATLVGCGKTETNSVVEETTNAAETVGKTAIETVAEVPHEHEFTEEVTKEPTCLEAGEKTLTCECGETKTEVIEATGHEFTDYVSNNDATFEADGTETAKCNNCDETDTRVAEGSMLTYTYEEMDATKYAKSTVNVRSLPTTDGEKLGGLSLNDEVKVTGKCNETGWYRIEYKDSVAYVSDSYLVDKKVEVAKAPASTNSNNNGNGGSAKTSSDFPYELFKMYSNDSLAWMYMFDTCLDEGYVDETAYWNTYDAVHDYNRARYTVVNGQCPEYDAAVKAETGVASRRYETSWYYEGHRIIRLFCF